MNSKKIIFSILSILIILFFCSSVFAYTVKKAIPAVCQNRAYTAAYKTKFLEKGVAAWIAAIIPATLLLDVALGSQKNLSTNLQIVSISAVKYTKTQDPNYCATIKITTNASSPDTKEPLGYVFSVPLTDQRWYPWLIERLYENNKEGKALVEQTTSGNAIAISPKPADVKKVSNGYQYVFNVSRGSYSAFCTAYDNGRADLDAYVFKPEWYFPESWQDDVDVCVTDGAAFKRIAFYDLDGKEGPLTSTTTNTFFYNVAFAYGVPVTPYVKNYEDLAIKKPITIKEDSTKCTDPNYPYLLDFEVDGREGTLTRYYAVSGPNTFNSDKDNILKFIYEKSTTSSVSKKIISQKDSPVKADADKFTFIEWTEEKNKASTDFYFCLSKDFTGKKVNVFAWQYKDGNYVNLGPTDSYSFEEFKSNYNTAVNKEFSVIENNNVSASAAEAGPGGTENYSNNSEVINAGNQKLEFNLYPTISEIIYNTSNSWTKAKKINEPESFLIDYKSSTKKVIINLSNLDLKYKVYAIITTPEKVNEINTELNKIYNHKIDNEYILQNNYTINNSFSTDNIDKISFRLDLKKSFLFNIEKDIVTDKLVLIFLQITEDNLINITYTNLYLLENNAQSTYQLCEANKRILDFYCNNQNCTSVKECLERWDFDESKLVRERRVENQNQPTEQVQTNYNFTGKCSIIKQNTLDEYINCLKSNLEILNLSKTYSINTVDNGRTIKASGTGTILIHSKYAYPSFCYNGEQFNNIVFSMAKKLNLSEEETAQLWSKLAAESGCSLTCGSLGCHDDGIGQVVVETWINGYSQLKSELLKIDSQKYSTESKYQAILRRQDEEPESAIEISTAFNRANIASVISKSKNATRPITTKMVTEYDNDDAIDLTFITAYLYCSPNYSLFSKGINPIDNTVGCPYTTLHKLGYYLAYKKMIYNCYHNGTTNSFVKAYKKEYGGKYCDKPQAISSNNEIGQSTLQNIEDDKYNTFSVTPLVNGVDVVNYAKKYVGYKYVWGGNCLKTGVDCSGFVREVYSHFGIDIMPRQSKYQSYCGLEVKSLADAQPGDVIALSKNKTVEGIHHTIIYAGKDSSGNVMIVHAKGTQYGIRYEKISTTYINEIYSIRRFVNLKVCKNTPADAPLARKPVCFLS